MPSKRVSLCVQLGFFKRQARKYTHASPARQVLACKLDRRALHEVADFNEAHPDRCRELDDTIEEGPSDEGGRGDAPWVGSRGPRHDGACSVENRSSLWGQWEAHEGASVDGPDLSEVRRSRTRLRHGVCACARACLRTCASVHAPVSVCERACTLARETPRVCS